MLLGRVHEPACSLLNPKLSGYFGVHLASVCLELPRLTCNAKQVACHDDLQAG